MFVVIINTVLSFTHSYRDLVVLRSLDRSAMTILERMTREIRNANSINTGQSTFGVNPGALSIIKTANALSTTTRFYVESGVMKVATNGIYTGPLTHSRTSVANLLLTQITGTTTAIKIDMTLTASSGPTVRTKLFHTTIIMKES